VKNWEVMKAFDEGAKIESVVKDVGHDWLPNSHPKFNWNLNDYRVKLDKSAMLERHIEMLRCAERMTDSGDPNILAAIGFLETLDLNNE